MDKQIIVSTNQQFLLFDVSKNLYVHFGKTLGDLVILSPGRELGKPTTIKYSIISNSY